MCGTACPRSLWISHRPSGSKRRRLTSACPQVPFSAFIFCLLAPFFFFFFFFARERLRKTSLSRNAAETLNHFESSCCCCRCFCLFVFYKCIIILAVMNFRGNTCDLHFVWCLKMELRGVIVTALCVIV